MRSQLLASTNCNFTQKGKKPDRANLALVIQKKVQIKYEKSCEKYNILNNHTLIPEQD